MENQINDIIRLFHSETVIQYAVKEIRREDNDSRWIVFVDSSKGRFVIKIAANDFTSAERVNGWVKIVQAYRELGYYSPAIVKSANNNYAENTIFFSMPCVVWEEEYAEYNLRSALEKSVYTDKNGRHKYYHQVLAFLGKVGQKHYGFFPFQSGWVRFAPFGRHDYTDEIAQCVKTFDALVKEKAPHFLTRWEKIHALFDENQKQLAQIYGKLPTSVFQSDHFGDNLLLDDSGHFKGVIDYNLAGSDTMVNVILYTVLFGDYCQNIKTTSADVLPEYNSVMQDHVMHCIKDALKYLRNFYTFNEDEAQAIMPLYKYISCIEYRQINAFTKYQNDDRKLSMLFDTMEYELTRKLDDFYKIMLE